MTAAVTDPAPQVLGARGIGASEIAAAVGLSPYKSPLELWLEKVGHRAPFEGNAATEWGHDIEPGLRRWYVRTRNLAVWVPPASLYHPEVEWMRATPDGIALDPESLHAEIVDASDRRSWIHGFEAKNVGFRSAHRWGEPGSDEVPMEYLLQAQQGLAVTGLDRWEIVASIGGAAPDVWIVRRDEDLIRDIIDQGGEFWSRVLTGTPPDIDASAAWADYLAERYPFTRDDYVKADEELDRLVDILRDARAVAHGADLAVGLVENRLRQAIGEHAGIESSLGRITWKPQRPRRLVNWEAVARDLAANVGADPAVVDQLAEQRTTESKASRPFRVPRAWSPKEG